MSTGPNPVQSSPTDPSIVHGGGAKGMPINLEKLVLSVPAPVTGAAIEKIAEVSEHIAGGAARQGAGTLVSAMRKLPLKIPIKIPFLKV